MSSGTVVQPGAFHRIAGAVDPKLFNGNIERLGMTPRQMELNRRWAFYCTTQYDSRACDWDGTRRVDPVEREAISQAGFIPPGFRDLGGQMLPLKFRRPSAPYHLCRVITERFTGMLFSERRHPNLDVEGDPLTDDWVVAIAEASRLWPQMIKARNYGGAMGSVAAGFQFKDGKPIVEIHDPRWCFPQFKDRIQLELSSLEKRYMYPVETLDPETERWVDVWWWYRRVINETSDILYAPAEVGQGQEPQWEVAAQVDHNLGFCPVVWTQNLPVDDDIDGEPDCQGIWDLAEAIDTLLSQAYRGTVANCDPTLVLEGVGDMEIPQLQKGSGNAIKLPAGTARYLEISGSGPKAALDLAKEYRGLALEVAQCVLDHPDVAGRTATEIERLYSSMLGKADVLREQYGQKLVLPLVNMIRKAAVQLGSPVVDEVTGETTRMTVILPPRYDEESEQPVERKLGAPNSVIAIHWPGYFDPSLQDAQLAATAAGAAKAAGLIDDENASKFIAPYFRIDDVKASLERMKNQQVEAQQQMESDLLRQQQLEGGGPPPGTPPQNQ